MRFLLGKNRESEIYKPVAIGILKILKEQDLSLGQARIALGVANRLLWHSSLNTGPDLILLEDDIGEKLISSILDDMRNG